MALTMLLLVAFAAIAGGVFMATQANNATSTTDTSTTITTYDNSTGIPYWNNFGMGFGGPEFRGGPGRGANRASDVMDQSR